MNFEDLRYEKSAAVARISFNRPDRRNALGDGTTRHLLQLCEDAEADSGIRVLVIRGEGDAFCSGGDIEDTFVRGADKTAEQWADRIRIGPNQLALHLRRMSKPVIACINGLAVGGGATIALACDLRIASDRAQFMLPFSSMGITPEFGCSHLLPRVVGLARAMELLMLGEMIDAPTAHAMGLVNRMVPHHTLDQTTDAIVQRLLQQPPGALAAMKDLVLQGLSLDLDQQLEREAVALGKAFTSVEHRQAVEAFQARRKFKHASIEPTPSAGKDA